MKTLDQLDRDVNALIKLVLCDLEELAAMEPGPEMQYELDKRRRRVVRKIWQVFNESRHGH